MFEFTGRTFLKPLGQDSAVLGPVPYPRGAKKAMIPSSTGMHWISCPLTVQGTTSQNIAATAGAFRTASGPITGRMCSSRPLSPHRVSIPADPTPTPCIKTHIPCICRAVQPVLHIQQVQQRQKMPLNTRVPQA